MNQALFRHITRDPRVQQLLSAAQVARAQHKKGDAMRLEAEAEALFAETEAVYISTPNEHLKDLKRKTSAAAQLRAKNLGSKAKIQKLPTKSQKLKPEETLQAEQFEEGEKRKASGDARTKFVTRLANLGHFTPLLTHSRGAKSNDQATGEITQFGLAGAGVGLMALEPATGGILLMFSCMLQAVSTDDEEESKETKESKEQEKVEESGQAGLFTGGVSAMKWLIADQ